MWKDKGRMQLTGHAQYDLWGSVEPADQVRGGVVVRVRFPEGRPEVAQLDLKAKAVTNFVIIKVKLMWMKV